MFVFRAFFGACCKYLGRERAGMKMVGTARFELATSRTPSVRATRLRYVPTGDLTTTRQLREGRIAVAAAPTRLSPAFEKRQESVQSIAQIEQHPAAKQLRRTLSRMIRAAVRSVIGAFFAQMATRTRNRKSLIVKQPLDAEDHVHVLLTIDASTRIIFGRLELRNLRLPVAQHKRLQVG